MNSSNSPEKSFLSSHSDNLRRVAIVGGGISGLSAAIHLNAKLNSNSSHQGSAMEIHLFEASNRVGGVIETIYEDGMLIERGADNFATLLPDALELSRIVGAEEMLIRPNQEHRFAQVVRAGKILPIPAGFSLMQPTRIMPILLSPVLSTSGKLRLLSEYFIGKRSSEEDESLEAFATRRLGKQAFQRLVEPIIGGIFTADAGLLSMQAAMPQFVEMEKRFGGLMRAAQKSGQAKDSPKKDLLENPLSNPSSDINQPQKSAKKATGARYDQFLAPSAGMSAWIDKLSDALPNNSLHLNTKVESISKQVSGKWRLELAPANQTPTQEANLPSHDFDGVIIATPSQSASKLLSKIDSSVAHSLQAVQYADSAVVCMLVNRSEISSKHLCFGIVVPRIENLNCLAISMTSEKYPGRTPPEKILLRIFMGGAVKPELMAESDEKLCQMAWSDTQKLLGLKTPPTWQRVVRWVEAMPQYHIGHVDRIKTIRKNLEKISGIAVAGNAYSGVGIPQCVRSGKEAGEKIVRDLFPHTT